MRTGGTNAITCLKNPSNNMLYKERREPNQTISKTAQRNSNGELLRADAGRTKSRNQCIIIIGKNGTCFFLRVCLANRNSQRGPQAIYRPFWLRPKALDSGS